MEMYGVQIVAGLFLFIVGTCVFSFLNVLIDRIPRKQPFVRGSSVCDACKTPLRPLDLIPLVSYVGLRGRCRYCGQPIGWRTPLIELAGGVSAYGCAWYFQDSPLTALLVFLFLCVLVVVTAIDAETMEIPDGCHIAVLILAVAAAILLPLDLPSGVSMGWSYLFPLLPQKITLPVLEVSVISRLIGFVCVSLPMLLLALVIPGAFGGGDIKLMAACGAFLGWKLTLISSVLGFLLGGLWGMYLLITKKKDRKAQFAFGPFLCAGMALGLVAGNAILSWYLGFLVIA